MRLLGGTCYSHTPINTPFLGKKDGTIVYYGSSTVYVFYYIKGGKKKGISLTSFKNPLFNNLSVSSLYE